MISHPRAYERRNFVAPRFGPNKFRILIKLQKFVLKGGKLEEIVFFVNGFSDPSASRAGIAGLRAIDVEFVRNAILPRVCALIDVAVVANAPEQLLHTLSVARFRSANEIVVRNPHPLPERTEFRRDLVGILLRRLARSFRRTLNLLPMLIGAGQKKRISTQ